MAKPKATSLIDVELKKFQKKLDEFQAYLIKNTITSYVNEEGRMDLSPLEQEKLHKEIAIQIKMQDAILVWLPILEKLKQREEEKLQTYGDVEVNGLFNKKS